MGLGGFYLFFRYITARCVQFWEADSVLIKIRYLSLLIPNIPLLQHAIIPAEFNSYTMKNLFWQQQIYSIHSNFFLIIRAFLQASAHLQL